MRASTRSTAASLKRRGVPGRGSSSSPSRRRRTKRCRHLPTVQGKTIGIDATTLETNAAMKSIVRRDTEESYPEYLKRLAEAAGVEAGDEAALRRMDRRRKKKGSNAEWANPHDSEAEITRMKDGRTGLAYKAEHAVDMDTGAIVAVTTHGGAVGDTTSVGETLPAAGEAVAEQIAEPTRDGKFQVNAKGVEEWVGDKGYHAGEALVAARELRVRTYIAEPERGRRKWAGKREQQATVYANRQHISGLRGKQLLRRRGELVERTFAHAYETGALRRLYVRGKQNVHKRLLLQAAALQPGAAVPQDDRRGNAASPAGRRWLACFLFFSG